MRKTFGKSQEPGDFYSLSSSDRKKIIKEAARSASDEQRKLVDECRKEYGDSYIDSCKSTSPAKN